MNPIPYSELSDNELLDLYARDQNPEWIGALLSRYTILLLGVCMKYLKNETEAKDGVQQIFLKVLTEVSKYQITFFKSWLYMVAKNHCLMLIRERNKLAKPITDEAISDIPVDFKELIDADNTYALLAESLEEINDEQRECVVLFYLKKQSYQQISDKTGFPLMQVKSYIQNGKRNLRIIMEKKLKQRT